MQSRCTPANEAAPANVSRSLRQIRAMMRKRCGKHYGSAGIRAQLPKRVWNTKKHRGRPIKEVVPRFQAERTFAWFQKKYRRLVVQWERIAACFERFSGHRYYLFTSGCRD